YPGTEDDDIGEETRCERAAAIELQIPRRERRHSPDGVFERCRALVANEVTEDARERSVRARMWLRLQEYDYRSDGASVGTERHPREARFALEVLLRSDEDDHADAALVLGHQVHRDIARIAAALARDVGERASGEGLERLLLERHEEDAVGAARVVIEVLPAASRARHVFLDPRARRLIGEPSPQRLRPSVVRPRRDARPEAARAG